MQLKMASPKGVCLGFLILVLCIAHGSARYIVSDELNTQLNQELMTAAGEPDPDDVLASDLVKEDSNGSLEVAHPPTSDEPTSLGDVQVACGHPGCIGRLRPAVPNCPTCGCVPNYSPIPFPYPRCEPATSPEPSTPSYQPPQYAPPEYAPPEYAPSYPPQYAPTYPPQYAPTYPPQVSPGCQPAAAAPPQISPGCEPACEPAAPPQVSPGCEPACEPASPPQVSPGCEPACQPASPPQYAPMYPPQAAPSYPPQVSPGCQPASSPQVSPGCQPASPTQPEPTYPPWSEPNYPPQPEPFYPPQPEPANPPVTSPRVDIECLTKLGTKCPESLTQNEVQQWNNEKPPPNEVMLDSIREKEEGGFMNERDWLTIPSPQHTP